MNFLTFQMILPLFHAPDRVCWNHASMQDFWLLDQTSTLTRRSWKTTRKDTCPTDQVLLWHHYADAGKWKALPYAYNIRRIIFRPLNTFHFACCRPPKPWSAACRPSRKETKDFKGPIVTVDHMSLIFWKNFYELLDKYNLDEWWRSTKFFQPSQQFGVVSYDDCWKLV